MGIYQLNTKQQVPSTIENVWDFISSPANLKEITPSYMGFDITSGNLPEKMYPGMIISYRVRPLLNLPMNWVTEITHVEEGRYFIDEQRVGPYAIWHHQHFIEPIDSGVLMKDIVTYKPPFGFLGAIANRLFITRQLDQIFRYRYEAIEKKFGTFKLKDVNEFPQHEYSAKV